VRQLQRRLRRLGFAPGPVDGLFGPLTHAAVQRFQWEHALVGDGVVGPKTKKPLLARPVARDGRRSRSGRPERAAPERRAPDRPPAAEAPPPRAPAPDITDAPREPGEPLRSDGPAPEVAAGLGALAMAVLLSGAWLLARRRRGRTTAGYREDGDGSSANGLRFGMVCAALLAAFSMGAAAGAVFATQATPGDSEPEAASVETIPQSQSAP
jgi:peptidoglycan hydrolase-like protein with peptidoglycan-binding domain